MQAEDLAAIARELLREPPDAFVAARAARVKALRATDRDLATAVGRIRKPSPSAWAVDLLAAQGLLAEAADLAPELRRGQAGADPATIGRLRRRRRDLVDSLTDAAADLAADAGHDLGAGPRAQVAATIEAATADPRAGAAVVSGLLVRALESVGFDPVDLGGAIAVPEAVPEAVDVPESDADGDLTELLRSSRPADADEPDAPRSRTPGRTGTRTRRRAATPAEPEPDPRALRAARDAVEAADAAVADLDSRVDDARTRRRDLEDRRTELERELRDVRRALTDAVRDTEWLEGEHAAAERAADDARAALRRVERG